MQGREIARDIFYIRTIVITFPGYAVGVGVLVAEEKAVVGYAHQVCVQRTRFGGGIRIHKLRNGGLRNETENGE